ncbi:FACT complex subunit SSRP1 [Trichostrongylus colubriformis]|uniref:FACT complex subunit SSRP1 n=1 Tax=Trichostrongylus colubriformis TaxID=6319 RepID=A0AAN8FXL0_TRICO
MVDALEFGDVFTEDMGVLNPGRVKLAESMIQFKNEKTGKLSTISASELDGLNWQRLGNRPGLKMRCSDGKKIRLGGFKDSDLEKIRQFAQKNWHKEVEHNELVLKGWNYGNCQVDGQSVEFTLDNKPVFEVPLSNVANCVGNKSEATLEFHQNDDCPTSLIEMRFHMPADVDDEESDPVEVCKVIDWQQLHDQYGGKLEKELSGPLYEVVSKIFRVLINMKITVPGNFVGHSGTPAVMCAHKQASGFLYPLEKGFLYIHKPPMYIRFEEVSSVHFARSDVSTRSFDFEIELKVGQVLVFNSVEKEEYNKLYDYVQNKHLRIRNAKKMDKSYAEDRFAGSDDEIDPYKETVKAEGKERAGGDSDDDSDSEDDDYDLDEDIKKRKQNRESSEGSGSEPDEEFDSDAASTDESGSGGSDDEASPKKKKKKEKESKPKEKKERKEKGEGKKKREKKEKDPNAPKRAQSAYFLWLNENRAKIKKEGDSVADVAKRAGEMWKAMDAESKAPWEKKAAADKERYDSEMKEFKKSGAKAPSSETTSKKSSGPSPLKAKSKEYISDSDDSDDDDDKPLRPKEKKDKEVKKEVKEEVKL